MTKYNDGAWNWNCMDCGIDTAGSIQPRTPSEYYMLHYKLWEEAVAKPDRGRMLCIGCVETRLGRKLTKADFHPGKNNNGGINSLDYTNPAPKTERLVDRLTL